MQLRLRDIEREPNQRVNRKKKIEAHIDQRLHPTRVGLVTCNLALPITVTEIWVYIDSFNGFGVKTGERLLCRFRKSIHQLDPNYF